MSDIRIIEVKENILARNDRSAEKLREKMKQKKTVLINVMSSPGSGKTTLLKRTIAELKDEIKIGVLEADIDSDVDAAAILSAGADSVQLHTGGACHLTADMTEQGLAGFGDAHYDLIFIENVGNLVCPAEFDTGATYNVCLLSVPEGDDKPLKYPLMFQVSHAMVITKIDTKSVFDFDEGKLRKNAEMRHPGIEIMPLSAKTGEGFETWKDFLRRKVKEAKE